MRETKKFFYENNTLNKGYAKNDAENMYNNLLNDNLPPSEVLAEYESLYPGSTERFIKIIEDEQKHRHAMDNKIIHLEAQYKRFGQIFLLFIIAILSYTSYAILKNDYAVAGLIFIITSFTSIITLIIKMNTKNSYKKL